MGKLYPTSLELLFVEVGLSTDLSLVTEDTLL